MASFRLNTNGSWRVAVSAKGTRRSATFKTRPEAERWADALEKAILGKSGSAPIAMTNREFLDIYRRSMERARERGIDYLLTRSDVERLFLQSGGRCTVTGIGFNRFRPLNSTKRPWYPSLDRKDSTKPYTLENCRFVCVAANIAMGEWGEWVLNALTDAKASGILDPANGQEAAPYLFAPVAVEVGDKLTARQRRRRERRAYWAKQNTPKLRQSSGHVEHNQGVTNA